MKALVLLIWALAVVTAGAQEPTPAAMPAAEASVLIPGLPPGDPPPEAEIDAMTAEIGGILRCPVCQGLSVAGSTSPAAVNMQHRIRELVAAGYERQEILDYFATKYGEWILLQPTTGGLNWLVWIGPLLAGGMALFLATSVAQTGEEPHIDGFGDPLTTEEDPYAALLLAEVDDE